MYPYMRARNGYSNCVAGVPPTTRGVGRVGTFVPYTSNTAPSDSISKGSTTAVGRPHRTAGLPPQTQKEQARPLKFYSGVVTVPCSKFSRWRGARRVHDKQYSYTVRHGHREPRDTYPVPFGPLYTSLYSVHARRRAAPALFSSLSHHPGNSGVPANPVGVLCSSRSWRYGGRRHHS